MKASVVRNDLWTLGCVGKRGSGYSVENLAWHLHAFVDQDTCRIVTVEETPGSCAAIELLMPPDPFRVVARFAVAPSGVEGVRPVAELPALLRYTRVNIAVLAVSADSARAFADELLEGGVRSILNCSPVALRPPAGSAIWNIHPLVGLQTLALRSRNYTPDPSIEPPHMKLLRRRSARARIPAGA